MTTHIPTPAVELAPNLSARLIDKRPDELIGRTWPIDAGPSRTPPIQPHPYAQRIADERLAWTAVFGPDSTTGQGHALFSAYRDACLPTDTAPGEKYGLDADDITDGYSVDHAPTDGRATDPDKYEVDPPREILYTGRMPLVSRGAKGKSAGLGMVRRDGWVANGGSLGLNLATELDKDAREIVMSPTAVFVDTRGRWHRTDLRAKRPNDNPCVWPPTDDGARTAGGTMPAYKPGTGRPANRRDLDACRTDLIAAMADAGLAWSDLAPSKPRGRDPRVIELVVKLDAKHDRRDIAEAMGVTPRTIKRYVRGRTAAQRSAQPSTQPTAQPLTPREMAEQTDALYWRPTGPNETPDDEIARELKRSGLMSCAVS